MSASCGHPVRQRVRLGRVDALVRAGRPGPPGWRRDGRRRGPDQAPDGHAGLGVLVQVQRGLGVPAQLAALLPLAETGGDVPVRSGEEPPRGGVPDAPGVQPEGVEGLETQRTTDVRRGHHGARVHRES